MKLDQKQMHVVSQLFMAAGKAGKPFDLARLTKDPAYASETMAQLLLHADSVGNEPLQSLVISAMDLMASVTLPTPLRSAAPAAIEPPAISFDASTAQQYVGKLR